MDPQINKMSTEQLLKYIKDFIENSHGTYGFTMQFFKGKWRVAIDGIVFLEKAYLPDALRLLCVHVKKEVV